MQSYKLLSLAGLLLLGACAPTLPVQVEPEGYTSRPVSDRIQDLESAAAQLREQQLAMGQSLTWIEGQIKAMHYQEAHEGSAVVAPPAATAPATTPAQPHHPAAAPAATPDAVPEKHSEASPTPLVPAAEPAAVSALSNEDMDVEPTTQPHNSSSTVAPHSGFAVHLASYTRHEQLARGWREIKQHNGISLEGLTPFGSSFTDARGHDWVRLNVGPFDTRHAAAARCAEIKATGAFCDVQEVSADSVIAVN